MLIDLSALLGGKDLQIMLTKILICIPTYNESSTIIEILDRWRKVAAGISTTDIHLLVIDDNSPDKTADLVEKAKYPEVSILRRKKKEGLGPAYIAGFQWGIERNFDYFVECDADGSHQPEEFSRLFEARDGMNLVLGTRWMNGGKVVNWPLHRRLISRFGTWYAQKTLRLPYRDLTGGYRLISREAVSLVNLESIQSHGYGFQIEMAMRIHDAGGAIAQVPITFVEREHGESKMSKAIVLEAFLQTTKWALHRRVNAR